MSDGFSDWKVTRLSPALKIACHQAPTLADPALEEAIEAVWQTARLEFPALYNGRVFCVSEMDPGSLTGFWCEYRWVLAQMRDHALAEKLALRSLAVTGLLTCRDGLVLGRRNPAALYLPGMWQGVPAGSVESRDENDPLDLQAQLLAELEEEIGLTEEVRLLGPYVACEHSATHIVDLGFVIRNSQSFDDIEAAWRARANDEYDRLTCIPLAESGRIEQDILPTTRAMLEFLGS